MFSRLHSFKPKECLKVAHQSTKFRLDSSKTMQRGLARTNTSTSTKITNQQKNMERNSHIVDAQDMMTGSNSSSSYKLDYFLDTLWISNLIHNF